jgi:glycosyltransferase involved in cell wall biosynthesis
MNRDLVAGGMSRHSGGHDPADHRVLLFSYAFPPMQVQMTPAVLKGMAGLSRLGYKVDVLCADSFSPFLPQDNSLLTYASEHFGEIFRVRPKFGILGRLRQKSTALARVPDLMAVLQRPAYDALMSLPIQRYRAVITWSPFHSVNPVMVRFKRARPEVQWIAQFSDPWARNPLETHLLIRTWSWWNEPKTVRAADAIVHSSAYARDLMLCSHPKEMRKKTFVIPHCYDEALYPRRPKRHNERITLRYVGVLFGRRSPESLFKAFAKVLRERPELGKKLLLEFVGYVPAEMLQTPAARLLPNGMVHAVGTVSYLKSLEMMYDSDILLVIDADTHQNLFMPSKLADYLGANTPIVGLVPKGASEDTLRDIDCWQSRPGDIENTAICLTQALDYVTNAEGKPWCNEGRRQSYRNLEMARSWIDLIEMRG